MGRFDFLVLLLLVRQIMVELLFCLSVEGRDHSEEDGDHP